MGRLHLPLSNQPMVNTHLPFASVESPVLDTACECGRIICGLSLSTMLQSLFLLYHVSELPSCLGVRHCVRGPHFVYPFTSWWTFAYFHFLAIMNNATMSIIAQIFVWRVFHYLGHIPSDGISGACGNSVFNIWWTAKLVFGVIAPFTSSVSRAQGSTSPVLTGTCYCLFFWWYPPERAWGAISLWFWFVSSWWLMMLSIFSCAY